MSHTIMGVFYLFLQYHLVVQCQFLSKKTFWTSNICTKSMISGFLEFYIPYIHASHTMWHCHTPCYSLLTLQNHSILSVNYVVLIRIRISTARGCNLPLGFLDKDRLVKGIRKCVTWKWKCVTCHPSMILSLHFKCHT